MNLQSVVKKYNETIHHSTKMSPIEASKKSNEDEVFFNLRDKRKKRQPKYKLNDLGRTVDKRNVFSKFDSADWSYNLYKITEIIDDTIPFIELIFIQNVIIKIYFKNLDLLLLKIIKVMKKLNLI